MGIQGQKMNERTQQLAEQAGLYVDLNGQPWPKSMSAEECEVAYKQFAELIVAECLAQVARVDDMLEDEPAQKAAVAWVASSIADHFGVESQARFDQEAAEFIAAEDKKVASRYGYFPKLHPSEWQDK
jgi:hypothetical protein